MKITQEQVQAVLQNENYLWEIANQILYELCIKYPLHHDKKEIVAKMIIIGRSYSADVLRRKTKDGDDPQTFYEKVAESIRCSELDPLSAKLSEFPKITDEAIEPILFTHNYLMQLLRQYTNLNKRSFASKYLHFHFPQLFYIFDSYAYSALAKVQPRHKPLRDINGDFDEDYRIFFLSVLDLRDYVEKNFNQSLNPRELDRLLIDSGGWKV